MKKDTIVNLFLMLILMGASFYAGFTLSPDKAALIEKNQKIKELENTIVQQQISNSYIVKHMSGYDNILKYKNKK